MTTRITFEEQKGVTAWLEIDDSGVVTAVSDPSLGAHYLGLKVEGAVADKQNLQLVNVAGTKRIAVPSPIKSSSKR